jgi:succinoglycan biosynthesis protein ExoM
VTAVSVCVCTFRRPDALLRLLRSLQRLDPQTPPHEIIVVDNDVAKSAEPAVRHAAEEGLPVQYVVEPIRGIARARNRSVAPATGEFVAFIDDDEEADEQWLLRLWAEVKRHDDDGGVGPVIPRFNAHAPRWLIEGRFFERPRVPTGTMLAAWQARTGNALIRRDVLLALPGPFDERYDVTGGEDTDLFVRLIGNGRRIIAVDQAIVYEHLSTNRTTARWLLQRRFMTGVGEARLYATTVPVAVQRRWQRLRPLLLACSWSAAGIVLLPLSRIEGFERLARGARYLGRCAFHSGYGFSPYQRDSWR